MTITNMKYILKYAVTILEETKIQDSFGSYPAEYGYTLQTELKWFYSKEEAIQDFIGRNPHKTDSFIILESFDII